MEKKELLLSDLPFLITKLWFFKDNNNIKKNHNFLPDIFDFLTIKEIEKQFVDSFKKQHQIQEDWWLTYSIESPGFNLKRNLNEKQQRLCFWIINDHYGRQVKYGEFNWFPNTLDNIQTTKFISLLISLCNNI
jgi:hypothetical protein